MMRLPPQARRQQVPLPPRQPQAPFQLTGQQQSELVAMLRAWEERGSRIRTLSCEFVRWDYDDVFGMREPPDPRTPNVPGRPIPRRESRGEIRYASPDKGVYRLSDVKDFAGVNGGEKKYTPRPEAGEHWICDGLAIWEYNFVKQQLIERKLPPELQGEGISEGPLPFLFGAKADKLMQRYFLRIATPPSVQGQVWLEAHPRFQLDAANFRKTTLILDQRTLLPFAMEVVLPNEKQWHVHQFQDHVVNDPLRIFKADAFRPALPRGWTKVDESPRPLGPPARPVSGPGRS
jgi:TIGR03009 family protein